LAEAERRTSGLDEEVLWRSWLVANSFRLFSTRFHVDLDSLSVSPISPLARSIDDSARALLLPYQLPVPTLDLVLRLSSVVPAVGVGGYTLAECLLAMYLCDDFRRNGRVLQVRAGER
jgi:hypothetical protein